MTAGTTSNRSDSPDHARARALQLRAWDLHAVLAGADYGLLDVNPRHLDAARVAAALLELDRLRLDPAPPALPEPAERRLLYLRRRGMQLLTLATCSVRDEVRRHVQAGFQDGFLDGFLGDAASLFDALLRDLPPVCGG